MFSNSLVGSSIIGLYKRANKPAITMGLEVTAHLVMVDRFAKKVSYLFGTRVDSTNPGSVVVIRADCFLGAPTVVKDNGSFKPIEDLEHWFVTPSDASFAFVEYVPDPSVAKFAIQHGGVPLSSLVVNAKGEEAPKVEAPKKPRKPRKPRTPKAKEVTTDDILHTTPEELHETVEQAEMDDLPV